MTDPSGCSDPDHQRTLETSLQNPHAFAEGESAELKDWVERLVRDLAPHADSFALRLTDDGEMAELNHRYRGRQGPTDVLSFPGDQDAEGCHLGDVVISIPRTREQSVAAGHAVAVELRTLILHGVLHCLGYDHEVDDGTMDRLERRLRRAWVNGDV